MLNGIKNFAVNRILRHVADNPKLNTATNALAVIPILITALLAADTNWMLVFHGDVKEIVRVAVPALSAVLAWGCGKATWLKSWLPVAEDVIAETAREIDPKQGK